MELKDSPIPVSRGAADKTFTGVQAAAVLLVLMVFSVARIDSAQRHSPLLQHNVVSVPYPPSYPKRFVAIATRQSPSPESLAPTVISNPPVLVRNVPPPARHDLYLETAPPEEVQETAFPPMSPSAQPGSDEADKLALVEIRGGTVNRSNSRPTIQIGFGKFFKDDYRVTGTKNGTKLEEPGFLYVKTTFKF